MNEKTNSRRYVEVFSCNGEFGNTKKTVLNCILNGRAVGNVCVCGEGENLSASPNGPRKSVLLVSEGLNDSQNVL